MFITTYQKTGTHQLYPMFVGDGRAIPQFKDMSFHTLEGIPECLHDPVRPKPGGIKSSVDDLTKFDERAFGHFPYRPEFAAALQSRPTKVLFGIRDPRDVIVSELENIKRAQIEKDRGQGLWNWVLPNEDGKTLIETDDPLAVLIEVAFYRWPNWLGWLDHDFVMPVRYESLRLNKKETINEIRQFLTVGVMNLPSAQAMILRAEPKPTNPTFRKGAVGEWKIYFKDHHIKLGKKFLSPTMERLGYELDWRTE